MDFQRGGTAATVRAWEGIGAADGAFGRPVPGGAAARAFERHVEHLATPVQPDLEDGLRIAGELLQEGGVATDGRADTGGIAGIAAAAGAAVDDGRVLGTGLVEQGIDGGKWSV